MGDIVARRFRQQFHLIWSEASSFAIVRNPYDKLVSAWKYCRSTRDKSLRDALSTHLPRETAGETYNHDYVHFSMKQKDFIVEDNALIVDSLIRFETLQEDLGQFFRRHGLDPPHLPHRNRTPSRDGSVPKLTPEVLALIEDRFGADFDFFGYDRNLPSKFQP